MGEKRITTFELSKLTGRLYTEHYVKMLQEARDTEMQSIQDGLKSMGMDVKPEDIRESLDCAIQRGLKVRGI